MDVEIIFQLLVIAGAVTLLTLSMALHGGLLWIAVESGRWVFGLCWRGKDYPRYPYRRRYCAYS